MAVRLKKYDDRKGTVYIRSILVFGNLFFCLLGATVIGVGIYLIVERVYFFEFVYGTQLAAAACYLIITAGCFLFLISFIGCYGTLFENGRLLLLYCFVLLVIFMTCVIAATIAIVFNAWVSSLVRIYMQESLLSTYGTKMLNRWNNLVTRSWDEAQEKFECCAIEDQGWSRYRQSFWYKDQPGLQEVDKPYVPQSCCKKVKGKYLNLFQCQFNLDGPPGKTGGPRNEALHYRGCFEAGKAALYPIVGYFIGIGFGMAGVVVIGIVMSLLMYSRL